MPSAWERFDAELDRWHAAGRAVEFWLRDDDAGAPNAALEQLVRLCDGAGVPLALAVIPQNAQPALFERLPASVSVLQHGVDHRNRAAAGGRKTEFPEDQPCATTIGRLELGYARLCECARERRAPLKVLAPPWNRFPGACAGALAAAGYRGLSTFGARSSSAGATELMRVNTHVDLIDWRGSRGFVGEDAALGAAVRHLEARRTGACDAGEPTGWLSHHACHDAGAWRFLERLFERTAARSGVHWRAADTLFAPRVVNA